MVVLFDHPLSPYAQKVKLALLEKGIPFSAQTPDFIGNDPEFAAASPRREVPVLIDGECAIYDSTVILDYIEEAWPQPPLMPPAPKERARIRMVEEMCDTAYEAANWGITEVRFFGRAEGDLSDRILEAAKADVDVAHQRLEQALGDRSWLNGAAFGRGDIAALPFVGDSAAHGLPPRQGSRLADWFSRASARPSAEHVFAEREAARDGYDAFPHLVRTGKFPREYRDHRLEWMIRSGGLGIVRDGIGNKDIRFSTDLLKARQDPSR